MEERIKDLIECRRKIKRFCVEKDLECCSSCPFDLEYRCRLDCEPYYWKMERIGEDGKCGEDS